MGVDRCWKSLTKEEAYLVKLKLIDKLSLNLVDTDDQSQEQDKSNEQNNSIESSSVSSSPVTKNGSSNSTPVAFALIVIAVLLSQLKSQI